MKSTEEVKRKAAELHQPFADFFHEQLDRDIPDVAEQLRIIDAFCELLKVTASNRLHEIKGDGIKQPLPFALGGKYSSLKEPTEQWFAKHLPETYGTEIDQWRVTGYLCERMMEMCANELDALALQDEAENRKVKIYQ